MSFLTFDGTIVYSWTQTLWDDMNICAINATKYPLYDPNYYNSYCSGFELCFREYNKDCTPKGAKGITLFGIKLIEAAIAGVAIYMAEVLISLLTPVVGCLYVTSADYSECTFGLLDGSFANGFFA